MQIQHKKVTMYYAAVLAIFVMATWVNALDNDLARTPPMGWNSWNVFRANFDEETIKRIADKMVSTGLVEAGYEYLVIDGGWYNKPNANEADASKFPNGIKALADYVHERGLKLGLYTNWVSRGNEIRDVNQWVEWGVDYMKHDAWKSYSIETKIWTDMRDAILATGHPMVYSVHFQDRDAVLGDPNIVNMWRFTNDMVPYYNRDRLPDNLHWGMSTMDVINDMMRVAPTTGPGCWADADMLMVGVGDQTMDEWKTQFAMWCLLPAPLMIPSDLGNTPQEIIDIYLNKEMIAINQNMLGSKTWRIRNQGDMQVWARILGDGSAAVVLLNSGPKEIAMNVLWHELKFGCKSALVRDLWLHQDVGVFADKYSTSVPSHGNAFLKVTPESLLSQTELKKAINTVPSSQGTVDLYHDTEEKSIVFSANNLKQILKEIGTTAKLKPLEDLPTVPERTYIVIAKNNADLEAKLKTAGGQAAGTIEEQDYALRVTSANGNKGYWVLGGDRVGAMYGGIHIGEIVAGGSLSDVQNENQSPYIPKRGLKYNLPIDNRTPSFDDGGASANTNRENIWDIEYWKEFFDIIAKQRYNVLSIWIRHPFPSIVKVPGYEDVALDNVEDKNYNIIKYMSIDEKIKHWNEVLELAYDRGIECWFVTWNIHVHGTQHTDYGWSESGEDEAYKDEQYKDYLKKSIIEYFRTYPRMAGIGITAGENMKDTGGKDLPDDVTEQWLWETYGEAVMQIKHEFPDRKIRFVHRNWLSDWDAIGSRFSRLPDGFEMALKYAQARLYSTTHPSWPYRQLKHIPKDMQTWWNLRNDDIFIQRWGDPEYVREYILNFPHESKPCDQSPCLTAGFVMGSDRYFWGRESMSKNPQTPRQFEHEKHWYKFLLWGRLGYDPYTPKELLVGLIQHRFPSANAVKIYNSWLSASKIIPQVNRFHWWPWDYMWWVEKGTSNEWTKEIIGYNHINYVISPGKENPHGYIQIDDFVRGETDGISPLTVADNLEENAAAALKGIKGMTDGANIELRETLGDIKSQAHFGLYWAHKIRGGVELERFRVNEEFICKENAITHLEKALEEWKKYAAQLDASYEKVRFAGHHVFDWDALTLSVAHDIEIARNAK